MNWYSLLTVIHIIGTVIGAGSANMALLYYLQKKPLLAQGYNLIQTGMSILIISGFGLLLYFRIDNQIEVLYQSRLWAKYIMVLMLLGGSLMHNFGKLSTKTWIPISLVSWYGALILGTWRNLSLSIIELLVLYLCSIGLCYLILNKLVNKP